MKLPTIYVPEMTRDVETDMLVVGTALTLKINPSTLQPQHKAIFKLPPQSVKTSSKPKPKSSIPSTPKLSKAQIRTLITPTSPPSSLPKTLPKTITSISTSKFLTKASYRHKYTPSTPSPLRTSTISTPFIPSKPARLSSAPVSPSSSTPSSRSSSPSLSQRQHHLTFIIQKRHRLLFNLLLPTLLKSLITAKIADEILERRRMAEARDREMWERYVMQEAEDREMKVGRARLRMMSVWLDLKCLVSEGSGFVFESAEGGEERDERLEEEDNGNDEWEMEGQWREESVVNDVEASEFW